VLKLYYIQGIERNYYRLIMTEGIIKKRCCHRHGENKTPCSCMMGKLSRLTEPILLLLLKLNGDIHGYKLAEGLSEYSISDSLSDIGAIYRILRKLEEDGFVTSEWDIQNKGPARRRYKLTKDGESLLEDWIIILTKRRNSIDRLINMYNSNKNSC